MLNDLIPIKFDVPLGRDINVYPVGDLHYGSLQFDLGAWEKFREKIQNEENAYLLIVGDLVDNGLKSSVTSTYEQTVRPSDQKRWVAEQLAPFRDRIIAGVQGNHEARSRKDSDDDPLYDVFSKLDIENRYRENGAFVCVRFGGELEDRHSKAGASRPTYSILLTHGAGGGAYIGSSANRNERFLSITDGIDVLCTGHTHKGLTYPSSKLIFDQRNNRVIQKDFYSVTCGSWLTYGGYALRKMLPPTARAVPVIHLSALGKHISVTI